MKYSKQASKQARASAPHSIAAEDPDAARVCANSRLPVAFCIFLPLLELVALVGSQSHLLVPPSAKFRGGWDAMDSQPASQTAHLELSRTPLHRTQ
jgi:hypothetical protein